MTGLQELNDNGKPLNPNPNANSTIKNHREKKTNFLSPITDAIPARVVLYFLSWSGFLVSFMMRNDINFALVVMVKSTTPHFTNTLSNENVTIIALNGTIGYIIENNETSNELAGVLINSTLPTDHTGEYEWTSLVQSIIISSFYWCYVLSQVVGGVATQYFGTKNVFGWSQLITAICSLCIPYAANVHYSALIALRSIQGFVSGLTWPAMYAIVGYWIPPTERSRFMSSFQGFSIGIGLTYPLCGFIIAHWGWRVVFYTTGTIGVAWSIMWYFLAFNTPAEHPRISTAELKYIELNISKEIKDGFGMKVPWLSIFKSIPVWAIAITTFGRIWVHYTFIMSGPSYMKNILHFSIQENGLLSGTPFLCSYISSVIFCWLADLLVHRKLMKLTNVRKLFTAISQVLPGILCLLIGYLGQKDDIVFVLVIWFLAVTLITASYAGAMASIVDIAPNLAGPVLAFAQTIHMTASFISPVVSGLIVTNKESLEHWRCVFGIASMITIFTYLMFQIYGTADIQPWNYSSSLSSSSSRCSVNVIDGQTDNQNALASLLTIKVVDSIESKDEHLKEKTGDGDGDADDDDDDDADGDGDDSDDNIRH